jgi:hypothetical protein
MARSEFLLHYERLLMIGGLTIGMSVLIFGFFLINEVKYLQFIAPELLRSIPFLLVDVYFLFK